MWGLGGHWPHPCTCHDVKPDGDQEDWQRIPVYRFDSRCPPAPESDTLPPLRVQLGGIDLIMQLMAWKEPIVVIGSDPPPALHRAGTSCRGEGGVRLHALGRR